MILNISEDIYNKIKTHILFFTSYERITNSTLYELIKISPGRWFDIEEFAFRTSISSICNDIKIVRQIIQTMNEIEYNQRTGQIRLKNLPIIDDIVNERTVLFYSSKIELSEENLCKIIEQHKLTSLIVRFVIFCQLRRRDLAPLFPILKDKIKDKSTNVIILKMVNRIETLKIKKIINELFPQIESCLAIIHYFPDGCLSVNHEVETIPSSDSCSTDEPKQPSIYDSLTDASVIVSNYIYRANESAIILDKLIEENLKPQIYRHFVECRLSKADMFFLKKYFSIPPSYLGCFSLITYATMDDANKAVILIRNLFSYIFTETIGECKKIADKKITTHSSLNNSKSSKINRQHSDSFISRRFAGSQ